MAAVSTASVKPPKRQALRLVLGKLEAHRAGELEQGHPQVTQGLLDVGLLDGFLSSVHKGGGRENSQPPSNFRLIQRR